MAGTLVSGISKLNSNVTELKTPKNSFLSRSAMGTRRRR